MPSFISRFWSKEKKIINLLSNKATLCGGESITAGLIASRIASVSGASSCFKGGVVCYTNDMKINLLGVLPATINKYSAVSLECVQEMLNGIERISKSDFGYAISGYAGPTGNAGEVYIGLYRSSSFKISSSSSCSNWWHKTNVSRYCTDSKRLFVSEIKRDVFLFSFRFRGSRNKIRKEAARITIALIYKMIISS